MILVNHYTIRPPIPNLNDFHKTFSGGNHGVPFRALSQRLFLLAGVCAACMLTYRCLQMKWWAAATIVAIPSQKALLMCPYVSFGKFSKRVLRCSSALLHNLQPTSDCFLIFASHLATGMVPAICIISRLSCLQGKRGSFRYFSKNALLSFFRTSSLPSTCRMQGD